MREERKGTVKEDREKYIKTIFMSKKRCVVQNRCSTQETRQCDVVKNKCLKNRLVRLEATPERPQSSLSYIFFYTGRSRYLNPRVCEFKGFPRKKKYGCSHFRVN